MSWLSNFLSGGHDPAGAAMPYFDKAAGTVKEYMSPYADRGGRAGGILEEQFGQMSQDPAKFMEGIMQGYEPSKYYQMMQDRLSTAAANTAAAGGMRGSGQESTRQQEITEGLLSKDMQQYLQNVLGIQGTGLSGEQGLYGTGFNAAQGLAGDLSNIYGTQGQLAFQGERDKNMRNQQLLGSLIGLGTSFFGGF